MVKTFEGDASKERVEDVRIWLKQWMEQEGAICPCCRQMVKLYKRTITRTMARWMIWIQRRFAMLNERHEMIDPQAPTDGLWVSVTEAPLRGGDYAKLAHWGLLESHAEGRGDGLWRPTELGSLFALGLAEVPAYLKIYNNRVVTRSKGTVGIREALGNDWLYNLLITCSNEDLQSKSFWYAQELPEGTLGDPPADSEPGDDEDQTEP